MRTCNKRRHLCQSLTTSLSPTVPPKFFFLSLFLRCTPPGVPGLPRLLFPSGAQISALLIFELLLLFVHTVDGLISCLADVFSKFSKDISGGIYQASPHLFRWFSRLQGNTHIINNTVRFGAVGATFLLTVLC